MLPAFVRLRSECQMRERPPFRTLRFPNQPHPGLLWRSIRLLRITLDAGTDDILPSHRSATVARKHVIEIQVLPVKYLPAVLAGIPIPFKNVVPCELHLFPRHAIEKNQQNYPRYPNAPARRLHHVWVRLPFTQVTPTFKIVRGKTSVIRVNNLRMTLAQKRKSPPGGADVNRLPQPVQNKNMSVEEHKDP